ncbi:hypothetical protein [Xanthomonas sacchari]|uniref:hypothetical protein n=1 Tax=Xanthomonas sacchari TaxID=56458 RepID=UPI00225E32DD|nr:hypothetical protein [Xanthomonas sacchari]
MKPLLVLLVLLSITGCQPTGDLVLSLELSEGHGKCATERMKDALDRARVVEIIPSRRSCSAGELTSDALNLLSHCPQAVTTIHFQRKANPQRTDAISQPGWIVDGTPTRIARTSGGDFAVFLPAGSRALHLANDKCDAFAAALRSGMVTHMAYAAKQQSKEPRTAP